MRRTRPAPAATSPSLLTNTGGQSILGETVTLEDASNGNAVVGSSTIDSSGDATITVSGLTAGSHSIFAVYPGDAT